jgi:hypothetical protein
MTLFSDLRSLSMAVMLLLMTIFQHPPALASSLSDSSSPIPAAAVKLVQFCADPEAGLDAQAVATLLDYILDPKSNKEADLPRHEECPGAYYEYDIKTAFPRFLEYSYHPQIPSILTRPSSMRYSLWIGPQGESRKMPDIWRLASPAGEPVIIRGLQYDVNTPELTTGIYFGYNLKKTFILLKHKGRSVLISISKQINSSDPGKKGAILGDDEHWNYYYSGETGLPITGLGWIDSYIYDFFSVVVHIESGASPTMVRTGAFQWLRAGFSGFNLVKTEHILKGMRRYGRSSQAIFESPNLPAPNKMISTYQRLTALPRPDLIEKYAVLQQAQQSLAIQTGKIGPSDIKRQGSHANIRKEQIVEELMLEYLKMTLGKPSLIGQ